METKISTSDLNLYYGKNHALKNINLDIYENQITAFIGPSGCGKSTYLKTLNRMNDLVPNVTINGKVLIDGEESEWSSTARIRRGASATNAGRRMPCQSAAL